jgi:hypothetical protein
MRMSIPDSANRGRSIAALALAALLGCGGGGADRAQQQIEEREEPPEAPRVVVLEAGDAMTVVLQQALSTEATPVGAKFDAVTEGPILEDGVVAIPAGSTIRGSVAAAERASALGGKARMQLRFESLSTPDGRQLAITAQPLTLEGKSTARGDVEKVVGGAVGGGMLGGILGGKEGAAKGAAAGTVAGGIWAVATRGNDIVLPTGTKMIVTLTGSLPVTLALASP